jgi:hypothetical protein
MKIQLARYEQIRFWPPLSTRISHIQQLVALKPNNQIALKYTQVRTCIYFKYSILRRDRIIISHAASVSNVVIYTPRNLYIYTHLWLIVGQRSQ